MQIRIHNKSRNSRHIDTSQETTCLKPSSKIISINFSRCFILLNDGQHWYSMSRLNLEDPKLALELKNY